MSKSCRVLLTLLLFPAAANAQETEDPVAKAEARIEEVVAEAEQAVKSAREAMLTAFDEAVGALLEAKSVPDDVIHELDAQKASFARCGEMPSHKSMAKPSKAYLDALGHAKGRRDEELSAAIKPLRTKKTRSDWLVLSKRVKELQAEELAPIPAKVGKDDQLQFWPVGTKVEGVRYQDEGGRKEGPRLSGRVMTSTATEFVVEVKQKGNAPLPVATLTYKRTKVDPRTGKVWLEMTDWHSRPQGHDPHAGGVVVIDGDKLEGEFKHSYWENWRKKRGERIKTPLRPLKLQASR